MCLEVYAVQRPGRPHRARIVVGSCRLVLGRAYARGDRSDANPTRRLLPPRERDIGNRLPALPATLTRTGSGFLPLPHASRKGPNEIRVCERSDRMVGGSAGGGPLQRECNGLRREGDPAVHPRARLLRDRPDRWPRVRDPPQRVPADPPGLRRALERIHDGDSGHRAHRVPSADARSAGARPPRTELASPRRGGREEPARRRRTRRNSGR